jgi:hypothetical protein
MGSVCANCLGRDFQPAAAAAAYFGFGELEEALIHGGGGAANAGGVDPGVIIKNDVAQAKCKLLSPESRPGLYLYLPKRRVRFLLGCARAQRRTGRDMPRLLCSCRFPFLCKQCAYAAAAPAYSGAMPRCRCHNHGNVSFTLLAYCLHSSGLSSSVSLSLCASSWRRMERGRGERDA